MHIFNIHYLVNKNISWTHLWYIELIYMSHISLDCNLWTARVLKFGHFYYLLFENAKYILLNCEYFFFPLIYHDLLTLVRERSSRKNHSDLSDALSCSEKIRLSDDLKKKKKMRFALYEKELLVYRLCQRIQERYSFCYFKSFLTLFKFWELNSVYWCPSLIMQIVFCQILFYFSKFKSPEMD